MGRKLTSAALAASLALSGTGPIYAQEIRVVSARAQAGRAGEAGVANLPLVLAPLSPSAFNASLVPSLSGGLAAPSIAPSPTALGGHARALPAVANPSILPAPSVEPLSVEPPVAAPKPLASAPAEKGKLAVSPRGSASRKEGDGAELSPEASEGDAKDFADAQFRRLRPENEAGVSSDGGAPVAAGPAGERKHRWLRRLAIPAALGASEAVVASGARFGGILPAPEAAPGVMGLIQDHVGRNGYLLGNLLAFAFPAAEIIATLKSGRLGASAWMIGVLAVASLSLGVVSAPLAGLAFWGIQNNFAAAIILMGPAAARWSRKTSERQGTPLTKKQIVKGGVMTIGSALAIATAVYFGALLVVPAALTGWLGAAGIAKLTLGIMWGTGIGYFLLFLDLPSLLRGKRPQSFTPVFTVLFLLTSVGFVLWTGNQALLAPAGSDKRSEFFLYSMLNVGYIVVSGISWWWFRNRSDKPVTVASVDEAPPAQPAIVPPPARAPPQRFAGLAAAEARAHSSARSRAGNVRLLRVAVDLRKSGPRWVFAFHAPAKRQILTYGPKGVEARKLGHDERPPMLRAEDLASVDLDARLAALKAKEPGFKPVRADIVAKGLGGLKVLVFDSKHNVREASLPANPTIAPEAVAGTLVEPIPAELSTDSSRDESVDNSPAAPAEPIETPASIVAPVAPVETPAADLSTDPSRDGSVDNSPVESVATTFAEGEPALPRSWKRFPAEAREATTAAMLAAKAEAQARARALAPDARLVSVAINLEDSRSHWIFIFRSDKRREELTVWTKRVAVRKLGPRPLKAPTLWDARLGAMGLLDRAYAALKTAEPRFRPVRLEVDPAWTGAASYRFLDARGRALSVGADGTVRRPAALPLSPDAKPPKSIASLPEDARGADGKSLLALKVQAQARARALAPDARLVKASIGLEDARAHWVFTFRSDKRGEELTVWTKRVAVKRLRPGTRRVPTLNDARLEKASSVSAAYASLKAAKPGLKPLRLELIPTWKGDAAWSFKDSRGRGTAVASVAAPSVAAVAVSAPDERGPPAAQEAPVEAAVPAEPSAPAAQAEPADPAAQAEPAAPADAELPPADAPKTEEPKTDAAPFPAVAGPVKHLHENFLGFRKVKGVRHDPALKPLLKISSIDQVVDQISRQFNIPRARVLELGAKNRLNEFSPLASWIAVYDRLQAANRDQFKRLDHKKYAGWKSFRELANRSYPEGRRGALLRASELHKHFVGAFVRFPYHLFDMFIFGYFRQAISFEFFHSGEDFMALSGREKYAEQWLESAMRRDAFKGAGALAGLKAKSWYRGLNRWLIVPVAAPLTTFLARRLTLAIMSAIAMGVLGAFAPVLPLGFALTSIPAVGPVIVAVLNGLPVAMAAVPLIGGTLAPVVAAAATALANDLILGPMLSTGILSTMLTLPRAARESIARLRDQAPLANLPVRGLIMAVLGAAVSWEFWRANLKSFVGLVTVGAEIEGIMTYADHIDSAIDPAFKSVIGREVHLFHTIGAAVERPDEWVDESGAKHENLMPFGGAITWGNVLLHKITTTAGLDISDVVMRTTIMARGMVFGERAIDLPSAMLSAQGLIAASSERTKGLPFDPDLWKKTPDEAAARIKELAGQAGGLAAELAAVKEHRVKLLAELGDKKSQIERLKALSRPATPEERAEYDRLLAQVAAKSDEVEAREKLAERRDLLQPPSDGDALKRLEDLQREYSGVMPPPPPDRNGVWEDLAARDASMKALSTRLADYAEGRFVAEPDGAASKLTLGERKNIADLVSQIEILRAEAKGEIAQRDATTNLLDSANRVRNAALRERRSGTEMLKIHQDMAKLASVMDLALSMNEINAAQAAIKEMMAMLDAKTVKINASREENRRNQELADQNGGNTEAWRDEIKADILADKETLESLAESEVKTSVVATRLTSFKTDMRAYLDNVNAEDRGASPDAATEYQRRIDLLPRIKEWRTNGNPNDPDAFSLKKFNDYVVEVNDSIVKAQAGLARLPTVPVEFAGVLIVEVPGPAVPVSNPTREQMLQILADRKVYWQTENADFAASLASVNRMLDAGNSRTVVDEFGDPHPESLPVWRSQQQGEVASARSATQQYLSQLDAMAANINREAGSSIPMLSGLGLTQLQDAIKVYGDSLKLVSFPASETVAGHMALMDLVSSAKVLPHAAREIIRWSKADATVTAIDNATRDVLPKARAGLQGIVTMLNSVLADVDADVAFVNTGTGGGQALIDRKTILLRDRILPALQGAKTMLVETLIPHQQKSIEEVGSPTSDYIKLYDSKKTLIVEATKLYDKTVPWGFATFGAADGNQAEARANIAEWRHKLQKNLDGYDDAKGHHKGIHEFQVEMTNRRDPNFNGTEVVYGETQPFSLPKKIAQYTAERSQRAEQINTQDAKINEIIGKIETISKGRFVMTPYFLPVGVTGDAAGVALVQAAVDADAINKLVDKLREVADLSSGGGGDIDIGGDGGDGTVPTGPQPPITVSENQQISLLALEAVKRLVPSSQSQPQSAPAAYAIARMLFSDSVVKAAQDGLDTQVATVERFLTRISSVLDSAIADIPNDERYAASNGTSESADQVFARKIAVFSSLSGALIEATEFFRVKQTWNDNKFDTVDRVEDYYDSLDDIYGGGQTVNDSEEKAVQEISAALTETFNDLETKRVKIASWLNQLNPKEKSALNNVSEDISKLMEKTRAVLDANIDWHRMRDQLGRSREILQSKLTAIDQKQAELAALLARPEAQGSLEDDLVRRIEALRMGRSGWANDASKAGPASIVVRKSEYGAFVDTVVGMVSAGQGASAGAAALKNDLLANPQGLASLIPNSKVIEFGDTADGFYMVYQSKFSVPHGLETNSLVTLGNVGRVFGSNVSISGYQIASPPSTDGENAPFGDKGIDVQIETLGGGNVVNYLNIDLHRFAFDIPDDNGVLTGAGESRLMIFEDFAYMSDGKGLYVGLAGFADGALKDTMNKPLYYGGNAKTSVRMTKVLEFTAEQRALWASDPRTFLQNVNLDFTGYDADLNRDIAIMASGDKKRYFRTQVGPKLDLNRLMNPDGGGDTFTLDMYWARTAGTDDINQQLGGVSVLKGFSFKNDKGKEWMRIDNRTTAEKGQLQNEIGNRLSVSFPDQGLVVSGEGRIIGGARTYFAEVSKRTGEHGHAAVSYGSQYAGMNNRLSITMNTSFTLAELWQKVSDKSAQNLRGGDALKAYNRELGDFFGGNEAKSSRTAMELQRVFERDIARRLVTQDIGVLTREIQELRKAGAFMENSRVRGMVGFVSSAVSNDLAERAVGGGVTVGAYTEMSLSKTQKQLIESKAQVLLREGLRLQDRMLTLTKDWQASVVEIAEAQWSLKLAHFAVQNAPSDSSRREAAVRLNDAESRLHQAVLRYNAMTGREPQAAAPFQDLNSTDLRLMLANIRSLITSPDRLGTILGSLNEESLKKSAGDNPFNVVDWIPWIDRMTIGYGVQLQDAMANQALTLGMSVRLPIYDPASKRADKSYAFESRAVQQEMRQAYAERALASQGAVEQAHIWEAKARAIEPQSPAAAQALSDAIRAYRNGLISPEKLRESFATWNWYMSTSLDAMSQSTLLQAQAAVDAPFERPAQGGRESRTLTSLDDAFREAAAGSYTLGELALRQAAAEEMARSADHRIQKAWLDVRVGYGLTATGVGWIPSIGLTGIPITPVFGFELKPEEMRELQVTQHDQQAQYYGALKGRVEAGLAVQFYQNVVAMRAAHSQIAVYDELLQKTSARSADEAVAARSAALLEYAKARETINFLLGRPADAEIDPAMDERAALKELAVLLAEKDPVGTQRRILAARVATSKAVEELIDKNLKVELLQLEPVSLVVRSLGRLMGALSNGPLYNPEMAAAARIKTLTDERERDAYDGRREAQIAKARLQLNAERAALAALRDKNAPEALLAKSRHSAAVFTLQASLLALGVDPAAEPAASGAMPASWAELTRRLAGSEEALTTAAPESRLDVIEPEALRNRSAAFVRYYFANQTLGKEPLDRNFVEGWIELRLTDPGTPPEVLIKLAELRKDKADRLYREALSGAASRARIQAAQFQGDASLLRYLQRENRGRDASIPPEKLDRAILKLRDRLEGQKQEIVARLSLPAETTLDELLALTPEAEAPAAGLRGLAARLIEDIRGRELESIRNTLFEGGAPANDGGVDGLMGRIDANTIAERMTFKGFTPVAAFGYFRGTPIGSAFLQAPDPRDIEAGLEKVMGDVARKEMQSTGRLQALTARLHSLMVSVEDGARGLEARRKVIEAAEHDLRARAETGGRDSAEYAAAQDALIAAWDGFARGMADTKADFVTLVTELEALGESGAGATSALRLRPALLPDRPSGPDLSDPKDQLLDYWTGRYSDPLFEAGQDELFARMGAAVTPELRERVAHWAALYRIALRDADGVATNDFTPAEKLDLLVKIDIEGKRLNLRHELQQALRGVGILRPENPAAAAFLTFMREDLAASSRAFSLERGRKISVSRALSETYWRAHQPSDVEAASFARLDKLNAAMEDERDLLLASYLAGAGRTAESFVMKDVRLDAYLKAQGAFDAELARALESKPSPAVVRALAGLYDMREVLDRSIARAKHGRGMAALDALIMLEQSRLRAARWTRQTPARIDPIADALSRLKETRARWAEGQVGPGLQPLYAITRLDGAGNRTWAIDQWLTAAEFERMREDGVKRPSARGAVITRDGRYFIDVPNNGTGKFEVVGGVDAADIARESASGRFEDNRGALELKKLMGENDFVAAGAAGMEPMAWKLDELFGTGGLHEQGRVFFFEAKAADGKPRKALHPLAALALAPDKVVMKVYTGGEALRRDRFPSLESLEASEERADFRTVLVSPRGADALVMAANDREAAERSRGWIEVKLNSYGFARGENGLVAQLYTTKDDFEAQWKAFDHAERDRDAAKRDHAAAEKESAVRQDEHDIAKAALGARNSTYLDAQSRLRSALRAALAAAGTAESEVELNQLVAEPRLSAIEKAIGKLPNDQAKTLKDEISSAHKAYASEMRLMEAASTVHTEAVLKLKHARVREVNAKEEIGKAELTVKRSGLWTLHRTSDLNLGLDGDNLVVTVSARGYQRYKGFVDEKPGVFVAATLSGSLFAAVVDANGRLVEKYSSDGKVDDAFKKWKLMSSRAGGDVRGGDRDEAAVKLRYSHYETESGLPVLLGGTYLRERLEGAESARWKAKHWAYLPFNWVNVALQIPRGITSIPSEFAGRDPRQQHYLGRAAMYKTEGGATEHHGFFRSVLGAIDVLNLLPDPAERFFDPSQFPDKVFVDSSLRPGEGLWNKNLVTREGGTRSGDKKQKIHLGREFLARESAYAAQDVDAARVRTLSRFQGGVEQLILETRRGRGGFYQESQRTSELGQEAVANRLTDGAVGSDPRSDGRGPDGRAGDVVTSATPGHLFVDQVERRVRIRPGADAHAGQARALDGYKDRLAARQPADGSGAELERTLAETRKLVDERLAERGRARGEQDGLRADLHRLSQRIGEQLSLERRIADLQAGIKALEDRVVFWDRYLRLLDEARRNPSNPTDPRSPFGPNPMFWAWVLALGFLAALASALWHWRRRTASPPPSPA